MLPYINSLFKNCLGDYPVTLCDIGFRDGIQRKWLFFDKYLDVIGFEADQVEYDNLIKRFPSYRIFNTALHNEKTELDLHITRDPNLCSVLRPDRTVLDEFPETERFDVLEKVRLKVNTLDNILNGAGKTNIDFIKIDTQGSELYILQGAVNTLRESVFGLEIEVEFVPMYHNQPLFSDVDKYVLDHGFQLFDLQKYYWRRKCGLGFDGTMRGQVIHANALYFRHPSRYVDILKTEDRTLIEQKASMIKAVAISWMFGYSDLAISLCRKAEEAKIISFEEGNRIRWAVKKGTQRRFGLPNIKGKGRISKLLRQLTLESYHGWAMVDKPDVGNKN